MRRAWRDRLPLLAVLGGAAIALLEGFATLDCAATPAILVVVAGSFGAGASLAALLFRRHRPL